MTLLGKTLKGNVRITSRYEVLLKEPGKPKIKFDDNICLTVNLAVKFTGLACSNNNEDYDVEVTFTGFNQTNTLKGLASVDDKCNIRLVIFGKYDFISFVPPFPLPGPLPAIIEDIFVDVEFYFDKNHKKCEYEISGNAKLSTDLAIENLVIDVNSVSYAKSGKFRF